MENERKPKSRPAAAAAVLVVLVAAWLAVSLWPKAGAGIPDAWKARDSGAPLVLAHQGGAMERPSESNLAFEHAASLGVDAFELDVALTADGILVAIHDTTLDRTTDGSGTVRSRTYAEIRFLDAGYGLLGPDGKPLRDPASNPYIGVGAYVPALEELFRSYPSMPMLIEIKDAGADGALAATELRRLVDAYGRAGLTLVASFHDEAMAAFEALPGAGVVRAASTAEAYRFYILHALGLNALNNGARFQALSLPVSARLGPLRLDLTARRLRRDSAARGMAIYYWTVNDPAEMERLALLASGDEGVGGVITDRPSELLAILRRLGLR